MRDEAAETFANRLREMSDRIESLEDSVRWHQRRWMKLGDAIMKHQETVACRAWPMGETFPVEYGTDADWELWATLENLGVDDDF